MNFLPRIHWKICFSSGVPPPAHQGRGSGTGGTAAPPPAHLPPPPHHLAPPSHHPHAHHHLAAYTSPPAHYQQLWFTD